MALLSLLFIGLLLSNTTCMCLLHVIVHTLELECLIITLIGVLFPPVPDSPECTHSPFLVLTLPLSHSLTLTHTGDDEAKRRGVQKSILERAAPPTFDVAIEMLERSRWCVYTDVAAAVDALLAGKHPGGEMRQRAADGTITKYTFSNDRQQPAAAGEESLFGSRRGSSSSSSSGSSGRVLPDLAAAGSSGSSEGAQGAPPSGGFLRKLFVSEDQSRPGEGLEA